MSEKPRSKHPEYSTLEHNPKQEHQLVENLPLGAGNQEVNHQQFAEHLPLGSGNAEPVYPHGASNLPQVVNEYDQHSYAEKQAYAAVSPAPAYPGPPQYGDAESQAKPAVTLCGMPRRTFWILVGVISTVVIIAAVLAGALGGTLARNNSANKQAGSSADSAGSGNATSSSTATGTSATPSSSSSASKEYTGLRSDSSLATASFGGGDDGAQFAVYYQDENNLIKQSFYNSSLKAWSVSTLNFVTQGAKQGTPLAAAATGSGRKYQIEVFYTDERNAIHELWWRNGSKAWEKGWTDGAGFVTHPQSKLALIWDDCPRPLCSGDLIWTYQDADQNIRIGNSTTVAGFVSAVIVDASEVPAGTGMAISSFGVAGQAQNYQFFYEDATSHLTRKRWYPGEVTDSVNSTGQGWNETQQLGPIPNGSSIASYAYGRNLPNYSPQSMQVFNTLARGVNVTYWLGSDGPTGKWEGSSTPGQMGGVADFAPVAANSQRQMFAISGNTIQWYQVADDGRTWSYKGNVPTK